MCFTLRGTDLTLVSWGAMLRDPGRRRCAFAAEGHLGRGHRRRHAQAARPAHHPGVGRAHRTLRDRARAARTAGLGAEIAASLAEEGLYSLLAPVQRVTGYDTVMPLSRLE